DSVAKWDGTTWTGLAGGVDADAFHDTGYVYSLATLGTSLYVGGVFAQTGTGTTGSPAKNIASWDGTAWHPLGLGVTNGGTTRVWALAVNGTHLFAGGDFTSAGGQPGTAGIAMWDGTAWSGLTGGGINSGGSVFALASSGSTIYLGGQFTTAGTVGSAG